MTNEMMPDFLKDLEDATRKRTIATSELKLINMKSQKNQGKVIIVPINGENQGEGAIKQLNRVAHVEKWISGVTKEGKEYGFVRKFYFFMDPKYYGNLSDEQMNQLDRIKSKFAQVQQIPNIQGIAVHQLTLIQGFILKHTDRSNPVKMVNEGVVGMLQFESKNFEKAFRNKINSMTDTLGSYSWLNELTNRDAIRKRYLEIEFYLNKDEGAGFQATVNVGKFDEDAVKLTNGKIGLDLNDFKGTDGKDIISKFEDPIKTWLGIPQDGPRFNNDYINDIEVILNNLLRGENTVETRQPQSGTPIVPDSNSNFVAQNENEEIPTTVAAEEKVETEAKDDDLPF